MACQICCSKVSIFHWLHTSQTPCAILLQMLCGITRFRHTVPANIVQAHLLMARCEHCCLQKSGRHVAKCRAAVPLLAVTAASKFLRQCHVPALYQAVTEMALFARKECEPSHRGQPSGISDQGVVAVPARSTTTRPSSTCRGYCTPASLPLEPIPWCAPPHSPLPSPPPPPHPGGLGHPPQLLCNYYHGGCCTWSRCCKCNGMRRGVAASVAVPRSFLADLHDRTLPVRCLCACSRIRKSS